MAGKEMDYLNVLKALDEIPFGVGRKLLVDFLQGKAKNESIARNRLDKKQSFGSLAYSDDEIGQMIDSLVLNGMIQTTSVSGNKFWKVMELSVKGKHELENPSLYKRKLAFNFRETESVVTDKEKMLFDAFRDFMSKYNDAQKKAIVSAKESILCLAGAGSGKTTVLTKRIEFLVRYRSVPPEKILAITFTRKARQEMLARLEKAGGMDGVMVETFNSFCEKILKVHNNIAYDRSVRVINYSEKISLANKALDMLKLDMRQAINLYFSEAQQRSKTDEQLASIFVNDCFFIRDYFKSKGKAVSEDAFESGDADKKSVKMIVSVCNYIEAYMRKNGLRDFSDQLLDAMSLFRKNPELVPKFDHVLIDEYQDVNSTQINLVDILAPPNLFCVGDPRQSIYGWRGSDVRYILNFEEKYPGSEIITLADNYRSTGHIVSLINDSIRSMGLADLKAAVGGEKDTKLLSFDSEQSEFSFVVQQIIESRLPRKEIFVLARTNRQLSELSSMMRLRGISHVVRSDEVRSSVVAGKGDVTLATVHAIKGLEAELVFLIGCTGINFPCKGSEHPIIDMVKVEEYDKEEEERRLFYVAMSRAKKSLCMTYAGKKPTGFITDKMLGSLEEREIKVKPLASETKSRDVITRLKEWRRELSRQNSVPAYMILNDRTIEELARELPLNTEELEGIYGLGPHKIMKYGEEIIRIMNE
jgi:superfamily I DNA/RNA helicase